jgi:peptide deformylase
MSNTANKQPKSKIGDKIVVKGHPALSTRAREIGQEEIGSAKISSVIKLMKEQLATQDDGVAIAAPQIGEGLRIFVVSPNAFHGNQKDSQTVFINPKIIKFSKEKKFMLEGCLSVRWLYGEVERSKQVIIESIDEHGKKHVRGAGGLMAQIFQHEVDHLNGILFDSKAENLRDLPPEMQQEN